MIVTITSERQVTFPKHVLDELGVGPGDRLELLEGPDGFTLRPSRTDHPKLGPKRIDYSKLGTLHDKIKPGTPPFDIRKFRDEREQGNGPALRR